ncbi:MAG: acylphosphatase [Eubacteriales bacterium]|nr:acylphosphatase [Lachnospiraceae bacterium]MDD5859724.1 acylphosphatase [Eubacteriales bacterium]MCH4063203.1 acylphosphatase [Lachnospiraceae bacterium]MCH4105026.1 acylphosphatase [Lachnospiraceae bacterium]MCI1308484.1 acylphosphatase [Lachnospiraceae bacterium]
MESYIRKHLIVSGMVQAVGFRYRATYIAQDLGVTGWVRNMDDGRVEMEIQGPRERLELMMKNLGEQRFIEIDNIDEEIIPVDPHEYEFKVRY